MMTGMGEVGLKNIPECCEHLPGLCDQHHEAKTFKTYFIVMQKVFIGKSMYAAAVTENRAS